MTLPNDLPGRAELRASILCFAGQNDRRGLQLGPGKPLNAWHIARGLEIPAAVSEFEIPPRTFIG